MPVVAVPRILSHGEGSCSRETDGDVQDSYSRFRVNNSVPNGDGFGLALAKVAQTGPRFRCRCGFVEKTWAHVLVNRSDVFNNFQPHVRNSYLEDWQVVMANSFWELYMSGNYTCSILA